MSDSPEVESENISRSSELTSDPCTRGNDGDPQMKLENYAPRLCKRIMNRVNKERFVRLTLAVEIMEPPILKSWNKQDDVRDDDV